MMQIIKLPKLKLFWKNKRKKAEGGGQGALWFMQREVDEKKKFIPARKGCLRKSIAQK